MDDDNVRNIGEGTVSGLPLPEGGFERELPDGGRGQGVVTLPANYGGGSQRPVPIPATVEEEVDLENVEAVTVEEWLEDKPTEITDWVYLPRKNKKICVKAMSENERRELRKAAPTKMIRGRGRQMRAVKDTEWIQNELLRTHIVQPDLSGLSVPEAHRLIRSSLSGEMYALTRRINELSGFDLDEFLNMGDELE